MNEVEIKERCTHFLSALGVPVTAFGRLAGLSASTLYKWRSDLLRLSESSLNKIDNLLSKYGY